MLKSANINGARPGCPTSLETLSITIPLSYQPCDMRTDIRAMAQTRKQVKIVALGSRAMAEPPVPPTVPGSQTGLCHRCPLPFGPGQLPEGGQDTTNQLTKRCAESHQH